MNVKPIGERVLIRPAKEEETTKSGIFIPESTEKKKEGLVVAVGAFKDGTELPVKKGDRVVYGGYSSEEFKVDDEEYVIVEFKDVLAKLE